MNIKKLDMKQLQELINTTTDLELLALAEEEYINRVTASDSYNASFEEDDYV